MPIELLVFWRFQGRISNGTPVSLRDVPRRHHERLGQQCNTSPPPPKIHLFITRHHPSTGFTYCGGRKIIQGRQNHEHKVAPGTKFCVVTPKCFWVLSITLA